MLEYNKKRKYYKKTSRVSNRIAISLIMLLLTICLVVVEIRFFHISTSNDIEGIDLRNFSSNMSTREKPLVSTRGKIYGADGVLLAYDLNTYTMIAYLDESRTGNSKILYHVVDPAKTAESLAPILGASYDYLLAHLSKDVYQTFFGYEGQNITEKQRQEILELKLPGIEFIKTTDRVYPLNTFASYEIGYTKYDEESNKNNGELGVEQYFNDLLNGSDGLRTFVSDKKGYKIAGTSEKVIEPVQGKDVHVTIEREVQLIVEQILTEQSKYYDAELINVVVADAETGRILASSTRPSFDPNIRNLELYMNPLVSLAFEPGSTMKTYTYAAAIEEGLYDGEDTFESGSYEIGDDIINDWNRVGWGEIDYDTGYKYSSNVGVTNLALSKLGGRKLEEYFYRFGFGNKVDLGLPLEESGKLIFTYDVEVANAAFGQGITTTPIQHIQAMMIVANDGVMIKPYLIEKVVDSTTGEIIIENDGEIIDQQVISYETAQKLKELMDDTVNDEDGTGRGYQVNDMLIGKTGTAQIAQGNTYSADSENYIYSFAGMFPKEDPKYVIYAYLKRPVETKNEYLKNVVKEIVSNVVMVLGLEKNTTTTEVMKFDMPDLIGKSISVVSQEMLSKGLDVIVLGGGDYAIEQYPLKDVKVSNNDVVVLRTQAEKYEIPDLVGLSRYDAEIVLKMIGLTYSFDGIGYVSSQSIEAGTVISEYDEVLITLTSKEE